MGFCYSSLSALRQERKDVSLGPLQLEIHQGQGRLRGWQNILL